MTQINEYKIYNDLKMNEFYQNQDKKIVFIKGYSNKLEIESSLNEYLIIANKDNSEKKEEVYKIIGAKKKEGGKLGELELVLEDTRLRESQKVIKDYKDILSRKIKVCNNLNYRTNRIKAKKFPAEITRNYLISKYSTNLI